MIKLRLLPRASIFLQCFFLLIFFLLIITDSIAQVSQVRGIVVGNDQHSLPGAGVSLLSLPDSVVIISTVSDTSGVFILKNFLPGKYLLKISYVGFFDLFIAKDISGDQNAGRVILHESATTLREVNVEEKLPAVQLKGDTTQYNADAYKTSKDANVEDLATKMPGITIQDGKIQAQGEAVKKVLIDGKPYMGDDPNAALKNLPAEVVDKIQVFDKKSDQSEFTGFDDGNTSKTLNIITRPQFRNGTFGRVYGGYGTDDRWKSGLSINFFKNKRKLSILGSSNNINDQNFSSDDLLGVIGTSSAGRPQGPRGGPGGSGGYHGGGSGRYQPQNDAGNFLIDQKNGISETNSGGLNYSNQWKKTDFTFSYFFNRSANNSSGNLFRQYFISDAAGLNYREDNITESKNINHRANLKLDYKFDSLNSVLLQPRISYQNNNGSSTLTGTNSDATGLINNAISTYESNLDGVSFSLPLLYRHSFVKKGRTFSANLSTSYNSSKGTSALNSLTVYFADTIPTNTLDQISDPDSHGWNNSSELTYTEPFGPNAQLSFTYKGNYNKSTSDKKTFSYSPVEELYNALDTSLSNQFESKYISQSIGSNYRLQKEKWNFMLGLSYQLADLKNEQLFPTESIVNKNFNSLLPIAMFQYRFTPKKNMRLFYRSSNTSPTVNQLQNVINNNNPLLLSTGNPDLKQDWQNNLNIRYSATSSENNSSVFFFLSGTYTKNYIGNSTFIAVNDTTISNSISLSPGSQLVMPANLEGNYSLRSFGNYSFPVKMLKSTLNLNGNITYSRTPGLINSDLNFSENTGTGLGFALSSNISKNIDFLFSSNASYNNISNSIQKSSDTKYKSLYTKFKIQVIPWKGLVLQTDLSHQKNYGLSASYNQDYLLWNASIGYKFMKDQLAEIRLNVFDILKQNKSITRNSTDSYLEDVQSNVLEQYFMLTFTYNLKYFKMDPAK